MILKRKEQGRITGQKYASDDTHWEHPTPRRRRLKRIERQAWQREVRKDLTTDTTS